MDGQAFLITFREVLEALLIVGIITTYLTKMGQEKSHKWVWLGVFGAVVSSLIVAFIFQVIMTSFAAMGSQHYLRISIMLISSILLTQMVVWMADNSNDINTKTKQKLDQLITAGSIFGMVIHAYLVVLREGIETVFFFAAISGGDISKAIQSWGALLGVVCAVIAAYIIFKSTIRFPLKTFFKITGIMIVFIAAGLFVQAIGALQDYGFIGTLKEDVYNIAHILPEHPIDEEQLRREGIEPLISGQIGLFLMAMFGYSHHPSFEETIGYWGYFAGIYFFLRYRRKVSSPAKEVLNKKSELVVKTSEQ
ncbi:FTR1 family protein [Ammoniphilus sp. 3BR4]|uniref:FTR1 family iron permease n=1 Tax=Ammoniphilus sp. 3BR4 TaxID=3158265 RepID=UPI00346796E1